MKPMRYGVVVAVIVLTAIVTSVVGQPEPVSPGVDSSSGDLQGIRQALEELVDLYKSDRRYRDVDLILKRIDTAVKRLSPLERKLTEAEEALRKTEKNLQALDRMQEQQEGYLQEQIREGTDRPRSETRVMLKDIERSRIGYEENIEATRLRIQEYETDLALKLKQIESLDERLLDLLESEN